MRPRLRNATKTEQTEECPVGNDVLKEDGVAFKLQVLAEMRSLGARLDRLCALLEVRRPAPDAGSEALLEAISYEIGSVQFSAASLLEHAHLQCAQELHAALEAFFGPRVTAKRLGKWLGRMRSRGLIAGRYSVEHIDDGLHRSGVWSVRISRI